MEINSFVVFFFPADYRRCSFLRDGTIGLFNETLRLREMIIQKYFTCSDLQSPSARGRHRVEVVLDELVREFMFRSWCFTVQSLPCWARCDSGGIHLVSPLEIPLALNDRCGVFAINQNFTPSFVWWQELRGRFFTERRALGASK